MFLGKPAQEVEGLVCKGHGGFLTKARATFSKQKANCHHFWPFFTI
jgi:hypothetical protein